MTTIAVLADPPRPGDVLPRLAPDPLDETEAVDLYTALLRDACLAVERSGGDLLVNFRAPDDGEADAREAVADALVPALESPESARYEVQVGSTRSARVGNTVTHLLDREGVRSAAVLDPTVTLLERRYVDSAAMKLRGAEVVLGPGRDGRIWYAGFTDPVDFTDALAPPALGTLTDRARSQGASVDFIESLPVVERPADLASVLVRIRALERADKFVPPHASATIADMGLEAVADDRGLHVRRG